MAMRSPTANISIALFADYYVPLGGSRVGDENRGKCPGGETSGVLAFVEEL